MQPDDPQTILIVDDHPLVRDGLRRLLDQEKDLVCCGEAASAPEARDLALKLNPDIAIIDLRLKQGDGLELIKCLRTELPAVRLLVLSQHSGDVFIERALRAGAQGYVLKEDAPGEIITAIRSILTGRIYLKGDMANRFLGRLFSGDSRPAPGKLEILSDRELAVLQLLGAGKSTRDISAELNISFKTVESHRENIKRKLGLSSASELVHYAATWCSQ